MAGTPSAGGAPITDKRQLVAWFESGNKPAEQWRIGTEHEKFGFSLEDYRRLPYDGPRGIRALLEGLTRFGWQPVLEHGNPIALTKGDCNISLEPGGQFELSGAPLETIHQTCDEVNSHLDEVRTVCAELGAGMIGLGFDPKWRRDDIPWMPKGRYKIMRDYMPKRGKLGLDMMTRTCTVQVNLDYASEADMVKKFRVSLALQPIATALFAASPFVEGRPNGFKSYRSWIWTDTDPDRCGILPFVFEPGMGFERYVDYLLDVPMYFAYRNGAYIDASGQSFRDFLKGKLPALPGEMPTLGDFVDHVSTVFPEVRLKRYLEMRGADGGPWRRLCALPALWVGLLYDDLPLDAAYDLTKDWTLAEHEYLRREVPRHGLDLPFRDRSLRDVALDVLAMAREGLRRRSRVNGMSEDESHFLDTLFAIAGSGRTFADELLEQFSGRWAGDIDPIYREHAY
jgi:glutamate--cysteine ligase